MNAQQFDELLTSFAQKWIVMKEYHDAMQQAQPPIVTRYGVLTQQALDVWHIQQRNVMRKKLRRAARIALFGACAAASIVQTRNELPLDTVTNGCILRE